MAPITTADELVAAVAEACDGGGEARAEVVAAVDAALVEALLHSQLDDRDTPVLATGVAASPGVGSGAAYFSSESAIDALDRGEQVVLVCPETTPADETAMRLAEGIATSRGGLTSHAAVVARGLGVPAVCGSDALRFDDGVLRVVDRDIAEGTVLTVDGNAGEVLLGEAATTAAEPPAELDELLGWADEIRGDRFAVRANADTGETATWARDFGAQGLGLCRTEHMFLGDRLPLVQRYLLADSDDAQQAALDDLFVVQRDDFEAVLAAMDGLPVTVRLLDPPLHEFLPPLEQLIEADARGELDEAGRALLASARQWHEHNPMIGTRGVRLAVLRPDLYRTQVRALLAAAAVRRGAGGDPLLEIMVPFVVDRAELAHVRAWIDDEVAAAGLDHVSVGAMIETPRAALLAGSVAAEADFFSLGTNDLTQTVFAFSRDDVERELVAAYVAHDLLPGNPFMRIDEAGVGSLIEGALFAGRAARPGLEVGVCGEHGGDPDSIRYFVRVGIDYVSCSPFRVPIARLVGAQAVLASTA
ncbi:MAG: PEP-utilizing enzyme [Acidimicrobiia bacterium]|nr:PEP-utilizing enzyme [Acidimicrobiia bacterium]